MHLIKIQNAGADGRLADAGGDSAADECVSRAANARVLRRSPNISHVEPQWRWCGG